jgi:transcriptional regulator with XRE-family HTH domain
MNTIGDRIRRLREAKGLTRSELAYKIKISPQGMAALENGETKSPSFSVGLKLARTLGVSAWEIAFGKPEPRRALAADNMEFGDLLASLTSQADAATPRADAEKREARLERYATVHHQVLNHLIQTSSAADRLPDLLERLARLVPGSEALVEEIRTLRESLA